MTRHVKRKEVMKESKLELGSVRKKELVENGRQAEKRWRQRHAIGFPCARRGVEVDAVVGWRDLASSMIGDHPKVLFLHLCCRFNKSLPLYSLWILKTENTLKAVKTTAWLVVAGLYHTYFFICLGRLVKKNLLSGNFTV